MGSAGSPESVLINLHSQRTEARQSASHLGFGALAQWSTRSCAVIAQGALRQIDPTASVIAPRCRARYYELPEQEMPHKCLILTRLKEELPRTILQINFFVIFRGVSLKKKN